MKRKLSLITVLSLGLSTVSFAQDPYGFGYPQAPGRPDTSPYASPGVGDLLLEAASPLAEEPSGLTELQQACRNGDLTPQEINRIHLEPAEVRAILASRRNDVFATAERVDWGMRGLDGGDAASAKAREEWLWNYSEERAKGTLRTRTEYWKTEGKKTLLGVVKAVVPGLETAIQAEILATGRDPITGKAASRGKAAGKLAVDLASYFLVVKGLKYAKRYAGSTRVDLAKVAYDRASPGAKREATQWQESHTRRAGKLRRPSPSTSRSPGARTAPAPAQYRMGPARARYRMGPSTLRRWRPGATD